MSLGSTTTLGQDHLKWDPTHNVLAQMLESELEALQQAITQQPEVTLCFEEGDGVSRTITFLVRRTGPQPLTLKDYIDSDAPLCQALNAQLSIYQVSKQLASSQPFEAEADETELAFFRHPSSGDSGSESGSGQFQSGNLKLRAAHQANVFEGVTRRNLALDTKYVEENRLENKRRYEHSQLGIAGQIKGFKALNDSELVTEFHLVKGTYQLQLFTKDGEAIIAVTSRKLLPQGTVELKRTAEINEADNQVQIIETGRYQFKVITDWLSFTLILTKVGSGLNLN
ncbi:hypothetical protein [Parashewanella tropica]|uniref:hypothetical protein n=1 Tax=Parashewanella tropica TaxID=2547970 RepID=UPI0010597C05|nr:hypothetical protein [Parashewanella tropica]